MINFRKKSSLPTENKNSVDKKTLHDEALDWEASRTFMLEQSERRAWIITMGAIAVTFLSWLAIVLMMPLKESTPYVVRVDNTTGVPDIVTALHDKKIGYDDVMDKYWVATYVRARETYDWYTLQKDYNTVGLLSHSNVGAEYAKLFTGDKAIDKTFGNNVRALVDIISVVPNGKGVATVRFIKHTKRVDEEGEGEQHTWVATVSYEYENPSLMKESKRLVNPFGFQVLSYRVDPELVGDKE
jgi:type IV secretory pathway component VirB8